MTGWTIYHGAAPVRAVLRDEGGQIVHSLDAESIEAALRAIEQMHRVRVMPSQSPRRGRHLLEGACAMLLP